METIDCFLYRGVLLFAVVDCLSFIGFDSYHLKKSYRGVLLSAVGLDKTIDCFLLLSQLSRVRTRKIGCSSSGCYQICLITDLGFMIDTQKVY